MLLCGQICKLIHVIQLPSLKIRDAVTGGSVLASAAQPPVSVTKISSHICAIFLLVRTERQKDRQTPWVTYGGSTVPKYEIVAL